MSFKLADKIKTKQDADKTFMRDGTKYNHYGSRTGIASAMDTKIIEKNIEDEARKFGVEPDQVFKEGGSYAFRLVDKKGRVIDTPTPLNFNNRLHYPDAAGTFKIIDGAFLEKAEAVFLEQQEYIQQVIKKCLISDDMCKYTLSISDGEFNLLKKGGRLFGDEQDDFNGTPNYIACLDPNSVVFSSCMNKLRKFVSERLPIIENLTTKKQESDSN